MIEAYEDELGTATGLGIEIGADTGLPTLTEDHLEILGAKESKDE